MRFSWRGLGLTAVVAVAFLLAQAHGARALGAVIVPGVVVIGAAAWQVSRTREPTLRREPPEDGPVGQRGAVQLTVESTDAGQLLVRDQLSPGIEPIESDGETEPAEWPSQLAAIDRVGNLARRFATAVGTDAGRTATVRTVSGSTTGYDVRLHARGEWTLGPARIVVRDVFGLFEQIYEVDDTDTLLAFPAVRQLIPAAYRQLFTAAGTGTGDERTVFDGLREYDTGDPLRDIHWRTSAKRDELIVAKYAEGSTDKRVSIAATATPDSEDAMAEATASLAIALLDVGVPVTLEIPGDSVTADPGERRAVLASLARVAIDTAASSTAGGPGIGPSHGGTDADVSVDATTEGVSVTIGDVQSQFETLVGTASPTSRTHSEDHTWFTNPRTVLGRSRHTDTSQIDGRTP